MAFFQSIHLLCLLMSNHEEDDINYVVLCGNLYLKVESTPVFKNRSPKVLRYNVKTELSDVLRSLTAAQWLDFVFSGNVQRFCLFCFSVS